jgi:uncharacterized protein YihD (DUF1040 family)
MRDPERISEILNELKSIWNSFPDLRLGQMLLNVFNDQELYYVEDKDLIKHIRHHYSEVKYFENNKPTVSNKK